MTNRCLAILSLVPLLTTSACSAEEDLLALPHLSEQWEPKPPVVSSPPGGIPSDATVLFDGRNLDAWRHSSPDVEPWTVADGVVTVNPQKPGNSLITKDSFGDVQLHLEFRTPSVIEKQGQGRGNSGVFFMGKYELQILDSYQNETYANGQLGSLYKQYPPLANPARKPGEWSVFDVVFIAPRFHKDGSLKSPARLTAFLNGVLVQYDSVLKGPTVYRGWPEYKEHPAKLPLSLQDHGQLLSFRNIWIRELDGDEITNRTLHPKLQ